MANEAKKYTVSIPGQAHVAYWNEATYNANKDKLFVDHPDAEVYEFAMVDPNAVEDNGQYAVSVPESDHVAYWNGKTLAANKDKLYTDHPKAQVHRISDASEAYWQPKEEEARENLRKFNEQNGGFIGEYEDADKNHRLSASSSGWYPGFEEAESYLANNKEKYDGLISEREGLRAAIANNPYVRKTYERKEQYYAKKYDELMQKAKDADSTSEKNDWRRAAKLANDVREIYGAPNKYDKDLDENNGFLKFLNGFGKGVLDDIDNQDFWTLGLTEIARNFDLRGIQKRVEGLATEEEIDGALTPAEKAQLTNFALLAEAQQERADNIHGGYNAGKTFAESLPFMASFILSSGAANVAGKGLLKAGSKAVAKGGSGKLATWLGTQLMSEGALAEAAKEGLMKSTERGLGRKILEDAVLKPVIQGIWHTGTQIQTLQSISQAALETTKDEDGHEHLISGWKAVGKGLLDSLIENWSESVGEAFDLLEIPKFDGKTDYDLFSRLIRRTSIQDFAREAGFHGLLGEMGEEWIGNAVRLGVGLMSPEEFAKWGGIASKDEETRKSAWEAQGEMAASFAPLTLIGAPIHAIQKSNAYDKLSGTIRGILTKQGVSKEDIDAFITAPYKNSEEIGRAIAPYLRNITAKVQKEGATEEDKKDYKALLDFAQALGVHSVANEVIELENEEKRTSLYNNIYSSVGKFWEGNEDTPEEAQRVRIVKIADGKSYYVLGQNEAGLLITTPVEGGQPHYIQSDAITSDTTTSMKDYLDGQVQAIETDEEAKRMEAERSAQIARVQEAIATNPVVPMGTDAEPINAQVIGSSPVGVLVQWNDEEGKAQQKTMTWSDVATAIGMPIEVKTNAQIEAEEAKAYDDAKTRAEGYKNIVPGSKMVIKAEGVEPFEVEFEKAVADNGVVLFYGKDENGHSEPYAEEDVANLEDLLKTNIPIEESPFVAGTLVTFKDESGETKSGQITEADNGGGYTKLQLQDGSTATVPTAALSVMEEHDQRPLPSPVEKYANTDGTVNQNAFMTAEPDEWAKWNDEVQGDGGARSIRILTAAVKKLDAEIKKKTTALNNEANPDQSAAKEAEIKDLTDTRNKYAAVLDSYARRTAEAEAQAKAEEEARKKAEEEAKVREEAEAKAKERKAAYEKARKETKVEGEEILTKENYKRAMAIAANLGEATDDDLVFAINFFTTDLAKMKRVAELGFNEAENGIAQEQKILDVLQSELTAREEMAASLVAREVEVRKVVDQNKTLGSDVDVVVTSRAYLREALSEAGLPEVAVNDVMARIERAESAGYVPRAFKLAGRIFMVADNLGDSADIAMALCHEEEHIVNARTDGHYELLYLDGYTRHTALWAIQQWLGGLPDEYRYAKDSLVADEFIAHAMERVKNMTDEQITEALKAVGVVNENIINFVKNRVHERRSRSGQPLAENRRRVGADAYANGGLQGGLQEDGRDSLSQSDGDMGREGSRPSGTSEQGTERSEVAQDLAEHGLSADEKNGDVRYSVRYSPTKEEEKAIVSDIVKETGVSKKKATDWVKSETSLAAIISDEQNSPYLDYIADDRYAAIKKNSDYPQGTVDFNNICRKRIAFTEMYQRIQKAFPNTIITGKDLATIREIMKKHGITVACGLCYVEDRRQLLGEIATEFIAELQNNFEGYASGNAAKKARAESFRKMVGEDRKEDLSVYDLITLDGSQRLYEEHRGIYDAFQAFNNARGQQAGNLFQGYAEYKREILKWSDKKVKSVNDHGGLRIFSYSDFEAHHLIDLVQIIQDCARRGVMIQGYTKVPAFARAVANTNVKLNRSLIPLGDTGLVDGKLAYDPIEGIDTSDPDFLESNDNIGNILIGINDEQIRIAMADPFIHFIIPFHSNQSAELRKAKQVGAWTNYKDEQVDKGEGEPVNIYTDVLGAAEAEGKPIKTEKQFVEKFLDVCKERGLKPRFWRFLDTNAEGEYIYTPGYSKLLVDFKMFDETGDILPQKPVVAEFDDEFNQKILKDYVKGQKEDAEALDDEIYDEIIDKLGLKDRMETIQKAQQKVNKVPGAKTPSGEELNDIAFSITAYHGSGANFDAFDHSHMGEGEGNQAYGWGTYVASRDDVAKDYAVRFGEPGDRHLYTVHIPDDNGENYLHWDGYLTKKQSNKIMDAIRERVDVADWGDEKNFEYELKSALGYGTIGRNVEGAMDYFLGNERNYATDENPGAERNARILSSLGIVGMEIPMERGGIMPGSDYVIFDEKDLDIVDNLSFSMSRNNRQTIEAWLKKREDLDEKAKTAVMQYLDGLNNPKLQLATAKWFVQGKIRIPEDMDKVEQAVDVAGKAKVDPLQYDSPMALLDAHANFKPTEKRINPDEVETLHKAKEYPEHGVVVYDVDESEESRQNMRQIINTHFGVEASPWCLLQGDGKGNLTEQSAQYWEHYSAYPKQVAFKDGKLLAFSANGTKEKVWWDRQDASHEGIPMGARPVEGDELGRSKDYILDSDGDVVPDKDSPWFKGNRENGEYTEWWSNGNLSEVAHFKNGKHDGEKRDYDDYGRLISIRNYKDGDWDGLQEDYYDDGKVRSRSIWKDGHPDGVQETYHPNGNLESTQSWVDGKRNGLQVRYHIDGGIAESVEYKDAKIDGEHRIYSVDGDGSLRKVEHYKEGKLDGECIDYFYDGTISLLEHYRDGQEYGLKEVYTHTTNGAVIETRDNYTDDGCYHEEYWMNGQLAYAGFFDRNWKKQGVWKGWDRNGNLTDFAEYKDNVPIRRIFGSALSDIDPNPEVSFSLVTDQKELDWLNNQPTVTLYRAMELIDGELFPPMSQKIPNKKGEKGKKMAKRQGATLDGSWWKADENPELAYEKDGKWYFDLKKIDPKQSDTNGVLYNPYFHLSASPLNDQFSAAHKRPNLVVVATEVPVSELTGDYKAEKANDTTGPKDWHSGTVTSQLGEGRQVVLSRYAKPVRILSDAEVASMIAPKLNEKGIAVPYNVVTPGLRKALEAQGVEILGGEEDVRFSLLAPNGKPSNLDEETYKMVRTSEFKNWFGDWEAREFLLSDRYVSRITGKEFPKDGTPLTEKVGKFYREKYNNVVSRRGFGDVVIDAQGVRDSISHGIGRIKSAAFAAVPDIIKDGILIDQRKEWKGRKVDTFVVAAPIEIGNEGYSAFVVIQKGTNTDTRRFYLHEVVLQKNLLEESIKTGTEAGSHQGDIAKLIRKTLNASKVVDENGEPLVMYHGTRYGGFYIFDTGNEKYPRGAYFTRNAKSAQEYANYDDPEYDESELDRRVYPVFLNIKNPLVVNKDGSAIVGDKTIHIREINDMSGHAKAILDAGYDGVVAIEGNDEMTVVFKPSQIKSADPVVYDDEGNLIPLSERFNSENEDIRFSMVYHGGGAKFANFDLSFQGTGEGEAANGIGVYVTEDKETGDYYAQISPKSTLERERLDLLWRREKEPGNREEIQKRLDRHYRDYDNLYKETPAYLYAVDIPDDDGTNYIRWDKVPSPELEAFMREYYLKDNGVPALDEEASKKYDIDYKSEKQKARKNASEAWRRYAKGKPFSEQYRYAGGLSTPGQTKLSKALGEQGYVGIKVPIGYNNNNQDKYGGFNYVIFNEKDAQIIGRKGLLGARGDDEGIRFSFIGAEGAGRMAKAENDLAIIANMSSAMLMDKEGKDARAIKMATGWEKGVDGKWRYELPDVELISANGREVGMENTVYAKIDKYGEHSKLSDILVHNDAYKQLMKAYPDLADMEVYAKTSPEDSRAWYEPQGDRIGFNREKMYEMEPEELLGSLVHEMQHAIQEREGFAKGADAYNLEGYETLEKLDKEREEATKKYHEAIKNDPVVRFMYAALTHQTLSDEDYKLGASRVGPAWVRLYNTPIAARTTEQRERALKSAQEYERNLKKTEQYKDAYEASVNAVKAAMDERFRIYRSHAGEVEARNVTNRLALSEEARKETTAEMTEDVPRSEQIIDMRNLRNAELAKFEMESVFDDVDINEGAEDLRFSVANERQDIFVSNAEVAVGAIPMGKATPEQWLKMIESKGGLKSGEDKWLGLSDWLKSQDKKTLSKEEVLQYINENKIQIEEEHYSEANEAEEEAAMAEYNAEYQECLEKTDGNGEAAFDMMKERYGDDFGMAFDWESDPSGYHLIPQLTWNEDPTDALQYFFDQKTKRSEKTINKVRMEYTTGGLKNKREIALTVPTIEPWNEGDDIHFGDAGEGRAISWIRFGETYAQSPMVNAAEQEFQKASAEVEDYENELKNKYFEEGDEIFEDWFSRATPEEMAEYKRLWRAVDRANIKYQEEKAAKGNVLVIDEIQSKRHQEGREKGYRPAKSEIAPQIDHLGRLYSEMRYEKSQLRERAKAIKDDLMAGSSMDEYLHSVINNKELDSINERLAELERDIVANRAEVEAIRNRYAEAIPAAPFEKNWYELAMKRMLRLAAEEGYDYVAWTTGEQQADRYNLSYVLKNIGVTKFANGEGWRLLFELQDGRNEDAFFNKDGIGYGGSQFDGKQMSEVIGKDLAKQIMERETPKGVKFSYKSIEDAYDINGDGLRIGGEGMKGFYDDILPRFMNKYGKKWGVQVEDLELPNIYDELGHPVTMHSVPVTKEMRESVLNGQLMFSLADRSVEKAREGGLPAVIGKENASEFYGDLYKALPTELREEIVGSALDGDLNFRNTLSEELAEAARGGDKEGLFGLAKSLLESYLGEPISYPAARYIFSRGETGVDESDALALAEDIATRDRDGIGVYGERVPSGEELDFSLSSNLNEADKTAEETVDEAEKTKRVSRKQMRGDLLTVAKAMATQKEYDKKTVEAITNLAKQLLKDEEIDVVSRRDVARLLGLVRTSVGRAPRVVKRNADTIVNIVIDQLLKREKNIYSKMVKRSGEKTNPAGVNVMGDLDLAGQQMLKAYKDGIEMEVGEVDDTEEKNTLYGLKARNQARLESKDDAVRKEAEAVEQGLTLAIDYKESIKSLADEEKSLRRDVEDFEQAYTDGKISKTARDEGIESTQQAIRENHIATIEAYRAFIDKMSAALKKSAEAKNEFLEREKERVEEIHHLANSDMKGKSASIDERPTFWHNLANSPLVRFFAAPLSSFDQMLRLLGEKSVNGEGYLWNKMMRSWIEAREREYLGAKAAKEQLDSKVSEVFGKPMKWSDLYAIEGKMPKVPVKWWDDGKMTDHELTQGQLLYIYMVNKMADGRMKLRAMGITQAHVDAIKAQMDERFLKLADWLQDEYLVNLRNKYNAIHEDLFGAEMAAIENYFPLKINKRALNRNEDIGKEDDFDALPATTTGAIIKRVRNNKPLDLQNADAFSVAIEHIEQMEQWAAFAAFNKDINTLLSYKRFRNQVQNMASVYGSGQTLWSNLKDVFKIAGNSYRPASKSSGLDSAAVNLAKGVTAAKISFRVYTALKQLLSLPAFVADANLGYLAANMATPWKAWNWAMENLPLFEKRWKSRIAGDTRLMQTESDWKVWQNNVVEALGRAGMSPNAFVDALTVSIGSHAMYQTKYNQYIKEGFSEEEADKKAKQDATVLYNETQQSNENAFVSPVQLDRTVFSTAITVFRNSSMGYQRQLHDALRNLKKKLRPGYKDESIEYMTKQLERQGLNEDEAKKAAEKRYQKSTMHDALRVATFGFLVQFAWNLGSHLAYLLFGDDDDKKDEMLLEDLRHALLGGSMEGLAGGNIMSEALNMVAKGEKLSNYDPSLLPIIADMKRTFSKFSSDPVAAANDLVNLGVQIGLGVNPETITDAIEAIVDASNGDLDTAKEAMLLTMRILQVPQSQLDELYIDELGMTARNARRMSPSKLAKRYARYKVRRASAHTGVFYSDEGRKEAEEKKVKTFEKKVKERKELHKKK